MKGPDPMSGAEPGLRVVKRSLSIAGHATSISLEEPFWRALKKLAARRSLSVPELIGAIDRERGEANLSSAVRVAVLRALEDEIAALSSGAADRSAGPAAG